MKSCIRGDDAAVAYDGASYVGICSDDVVSYDDGGVDGGIRSDDDAVV